ncbi:hypothetical protein JXA12_02515 [Candidatus Woesearchaeota archaeon]|nr:hypothetical protein [Candidatus Woesearchaeota archaeon]
MKNKRASDISLKFLLPIILIIVSLLVILFMTGAMAKVFDQIRRLFI